MPNRLIMKNIKSMARMAEKSGIRVILCTILPAAKYRWRPEIEPIAPIRDMNRCIERFARCRKRGFIDFYTPLAAADGIGVKQAGALFKPCTVEPECTAGFGEFPEIPFL